MTFVEFWRDLGGKANERKYVLITLSFLFCMPLNIFLINRCESRQRSPHAQIFIMFENDDPIKHLDTNKKTIKSKSYSGIFYTWSACPDDGKQLGAYGKRLGVALH